MGIVRTVDWVLQIGPEQSDARLRRACLAIGMDPQGPLGHIEASVKRSLMKNRWAASIVLDVANHSLGSVVTCRVDMLGTKHYAILEDLADALGDKVFADRGMGSAIERLGKLGRLFGRKEVRHLRNVLRTDESVLELGQGAFEGKQGMVILTTDRLFFLEKSVGNETVEEFPLRGISSVSLHKKAGGEILRVFTSGNQAEITSMSHGRAEAIVRALHSHVDEPASTALSLSPDSLDPVSALEQLAALRDKGILREDEFQSKKEEILKRW